MYNKIVKLRSRLLVYLTHKMALPVLRYIRKPEVFPYTKVDLRRFSSGTLGNDLVLLLDEKQLELLPYYAKHDIKHILLDYDMTDEGESCLQCFMLGNGHISFPVVATVLYGIFTMPEYWSAFKNAYHRGRKAPRISNWKWFEILQESTFNLKRKINEANPYIF